MGSSETLSTRLYPSTPLATMDTLQHLLTPKDPPSQVSLPSIADIRLSQYLSRSPTDNESHRAATSENKGRCFEPSTAASSRLQSLLSMNDVPEKIFKTNGTTQSICHRCGLAPSPFSHSALQRSFLNQHLPKVLQTNPGSKAAKLALAFSKRPHGPVTTIHSRRKVTRREPLTLSDTTDSLRSDVEPPRKRQKRAAHENEKIGGDTGTGWCQVLYAGLPTST